MAKTLTQYQCQQCGTSSPKWAGRCDGCGAWNSLAETSVSSNVKRRNALNVLAPESLTAVATTAKNRIATGMAEMDQVLGGGVVPGSVVLLSGDPGVGKSTLVLQLAAAVQQPVLYVSGEESASQIKLRAERLGLAGAELDLLAETDVDSISATIDQGQYQLVIIDSIQTMSAAEQTGNPGSIGQVTVSAQRLQAAAKSSGCAVLMIGHVTKEGAIAGPKILEHLVDVVLYLEGERYGHFKSLRGIKNRFGSTNEVGILEMKDTGLVGVPNPSEALLAERVVAPGSVVLPTMEGSRPLLVEVQALVAPSNFGYPKRTAAGFDLNRLNLLVAVLTKRAGLNLNNQDVFVNMVGGLKITEPAADLAIILSIASAFHNRAIKNNLVAYGEVGLSGEVRSVSHAAARLAEAKQLGFSQAVSPGPTTRSVADAIKLALESK